MKLFYSPTSPFVRKCLVVAHELGLRERIELVSATPHPVNRDQNVVASNPLGKIPTLIGDDGTTLYDSRIICEYLDALAGGKLLAAQGPARWAALVDAALADGIVDAAVLVRYETVVRPENLRWDSWTTGQIEKVTSGIAVIDRRLAELGNRVDFGTIAMGIALAYIDFRMASLPWRETHPAAAAWLDCFNSRPSMLATRPPA